MVAGPERGEVMATIEDIKAALPIEVVLRDAGIRLEHGKARCPFHEDKNPSFSVKGGRGKCWAGCFNGDVIDLTARLHGIDTKAALKYLAEKAGLKYGTLTSSERRAAAQARQERERKAELVRRFREWEQETVITIAAALRKFYLYRETRTTFSEAELIDLARLQGHVDYLEHVYFEILCGKNDQKKFELYREDMGHGD